MVAAAKDPKVAVATSSDSPRNVPIVDSPVGATEDAAASYLPPTTPKPPGRRPREVQSHAESLRASRES